MLLDDEDDNSIKNEGIENNFQIMKISFRVELEIPWLLSVSLLIFFVRFIYIHKRIISFLFQWFNVLSNFSFLYFLYHHFFLEDEIDINQGNIHHLKLPFKWSDSKLRKKENDTKDDDDDDDENSDYRTG